MFTEADNILIQNEFKGLRRASLKRCADQEQYELVLKAFDFANKAHYGVRRRSGEPYILHPISVAKIVVQEIGLGCKSICAALLHDVVEDTDYTVADIKEHFGERISILVDGLTKIKTALDNDKHHTDSLQAENFKRILLTLNDDARIVLIKLADRLHNLRTIEFMPDYKREKILSETMYVFIPLAHRLGLYNIKSELENIWLQFKEPAIFNDITSKLDSVIKDKVVVIDNFINPVRTTLRDAGYNLRVIKRVKTPYSIWHKMETKGVPFSEIYDIYAVRIIFEPKPDMSEREQCWHIFTLITNMFKYKPERTRDWVSEPKVNGYESLHLTAMAEGSWIEVQIRSERMNSIAERGVAAHWAYKKGDNGSNVSDQEMDMWLKHVQDILENPDANSLKFLDDFHNEMLASEIYVFTPKGKSLSLPKGATALDFAYLIHSQVGNRAIAAKVNMKLLPLSHTLSSGDQVEIITSANAKPKREWLSFLRTNRAKNQVRDAIREELARNADDGMKILEQKLQERNITDMPRVIKKLMTYYNINGGKEELYSNIALGIIDIKDLDTALRTNVERRNVQMWGFKLLKSLINPDKINTKEEYILKEDLDNGTISFRLSDCCNPIPGDHVIGIINNDNSVTIHKTSCPVYTDFAATNGNRLVGVKWSKHFVMSFLVRISINGYDRIGLLSDITDVVSKSLGVNMRKIMIEAHDGVFEGYIDLYVSHTEDLNNMLEQFSKIKGIEKAIRIDIKNEK